MLFICLLETFLKRSIGFFFSFRSLEKISHVFCRQITWSRFFFCFSDKQNVLCNLMYNLFNTYSASPALYSYYLLLHSINGNPQYVDPENTFCHISLLIYRIYYIRTPATSRDIIQKDRSFHMKSRNDRFGLWKQYLRTCTHAHSIPLSM